MFVKLCGFTREEDLAAAAEFPVSAAGFVFHPASPRFVSAQRAGVLARVLDGTGILRVGVFTGTDADGIARLAESARLDFAQVYDRATAEKLRERIRIIDAHRLRDAADLASVRAPVDDDLLLLDRYDELSGGGTGKSFDWGALCGFMHVKKTIIAGGINAANVERLFTAARPFGIDVSSGIEDAPGIKSKEKIRQLFDALSEVYHEKHAR
ncbi:MAG TPA: phosphoribosylanthranilate isomerase [Spirochaetota bacterium]|nr:phosphoribosylanthranilate isomerase [Spirochaetota bacterium]